MVLKKSGYFSFLAVVVIALLLGATPSWFLSQGSQAKPEANLSDQEKLLYHTNVGIAYLEQFSFRDAIAEFDRCLQINPKFVPALVNCCSGTLLPAGIRPGRGISQEGPGA